MSEPNLSHELTIEFKSWPGVVTTSPLATITKTEDKVLLTATIEKSSPRCIGLLKDWPSFAQEGSLSDVLSKIAVGGDENTTRPNGLLKITLTHRNMILPGDMSGDLLHGHNEQGLWQGYYNHSFGGWLFECHCEPSQKTVEISMMPYSFEEYEPLSRILFAFYQFVCSLEGLSAATKAIIRLIQAERSRNSGFHVRATHDAFTKLYDVFNLVR